jgi:hypothetical protein
MTTHRAPSWTRGPGASCSAGSCAGSSLAPATSGSSPGWPASVAVVRSVVAMGVEWVRPSRGWAPTLDDFLTLLGASATPQAAGHGDLANVVLRLLLEHPDELDLRNRRYTALLRPACHNPAAPGRGRGRPAGGGVQGELACKPASVPRSNSFGVAAIHLGPASPPASCGPPGDSTGPASKTTNVALRPQFGLAPGGVYRADRSPGRWCALTAPFHPYRPFGRRSAFCGTVLRVAPTGGWPAPCPVEAGLSSIPAAAGPRPPSQLPLPGKYAIRTGPSGGILEAWLQSWSSPSSWSRWPSWR